MIKEDKKGKINDWYFVGIVLALLIFTFLFLYWNNQNINEECEEFCKEKGMYFEKEETERFGQYFCISQDGEVIKEIHKINGEYRFENGME